MITKKTIVCGVELSHIGMHFCPSMNLSTLPSELIPCEECISKGVKFETSSKLTTTFIKHLEVLQNLLAKKANAI
jgi:hypothetical protein